MNETELQILTVLKRGENHGSGIMQETGIAFGTLYRTISNLLESGLIEVSREDADSPRRYYQITDAGKHTSWQPEIDEDAKEIKWRPSGLKWRE